MEDAVEMILQDKRFKSSCQSQINPAVTVASGTLLMSFYGLWTVFALPGFRKVPVRLKVRYQAKAYTSTYIVEYVLPVSTPVFLSSFFHFYCKLALDVRMWENVFSVALLKSIVRDKSVVSTVQVPYLPSSGVQTQNVLRLLQGRTGSLADLGSGDGRLVSVL